MGPKPNDIKRARRLTRRLACAAVAAMAFAVAVGEPSWVAGPGPSATRTALTLWFARVQSLGVNVGAPLDWYYDFSDVAGEKLEVLSVVLVEKGYRIVELREAGGLKRLRMARAELLGPALLERRQAEMRAVAESYDIGAYDGASVGSIMSDRDARP